MKKLSCTLFCFLTRAKFVLDLLKKMKQNSSCFHLCNTIKKRNFISVRKVCSKIESRFQ